MDTTNTKTITYGNEADALAGMIPIDIIRNILSYIDFDEYKKIHKNKMKKVLNQLQDKNEQYISDLVCEYIVPYLIEVVFDGFVNDGEWELPFDYKEDLIIYISDQKYLDVDWDVPTFFEYYVTKFLEKNPNSNIITDLKKIESNYVFNNEDEWDYLMNDIEGFVIHDCLPQDEEEEEEDEEEEELLD